ncbi:RNA polymerase sigma factor [soil metagenome]
MVGTEASDGDLLAAAGRGDAAAFARLVERHYDIVYRVAWRMTSGHADTEDIVQDAFMRLWNSPLQVRDARALRGWLLRVASNLAIDRGRRRTTDDIDAIPEPASSEPSVLERMEGEGAARDVDRALAALPDRQRLALGLVYYEEMSNAEAAGVMDISVDALESLLARARRSLKERLADNWQDLLAGLGAGGVR